MLLIVQCNSRYNFGLLIRLRLSNIFLEQIGFMALVCGVLDLPAISLAAFVCPPKGHIKWDTTSEVLINAGRGRGIGHLSVSLCVLKLFVLLIVSVWTKGS